MRYVPCWKQIGISKERYQELLHFCRQYPEWKIEAESLLGIRAVRNDGQPHGTGKSDPVAMAAEKRERLITKMGIVEECARHVGNGEWYQAIIQNICIGKPYSQMEAVIMPTSHKAAFFAKRRDFFMMLDKRME